MIDNEDKHKGDVMSTTLKRVKPCTYCGQLDCLRYTWPYDRRDNAASLVSKGDVTERRDEHSPLPWVVGRGDRVESANGRVVADMTFSSHSTQRAPANAALIVESVNQHAQLVEQRDRLVEALRQLVAIFPERPVDDGDEVAEAYDNAVDTLATVEQGDEAQAKGGSSEK